MTIFWVPFLPVPVYCLSDIGRMQSVLIIEEVITSNFNENSDSLSSDVGSKFLAD